MSHHDNKGSADRLAYYSPLGEHCLGFYLVRPSPLLFMLCSGFGIMLISLRVSILLCILKSMGLSALSRSLAGWFRVSV